MRIGSLVQKVRGYGHDQGWCGIVLALLHNQGEHGTGTCVEVLTDDGIEVWQKGMVEVIDASG